MMVQITAGSFAIPYFFSVEAHSHIVLCLRQYTMSTLQNTCGTMYTPVAALYHSNCVHQSNCLKPVYIAITVCFRSYGTVDEVVFCISTPYNSTGRISCTGSHMKVTSDLWTQQIRTTVNLRRYLTKCKHKFIAMNSFVVCEKQIVSQAQRCHRNSCCGNNGCSKPG